MPAPTARSTSSTTPGSRWDERAAGRASARVGDLGSLAPGDARNPGNCSAGRASFNRPLRCCRIVVVVDPDLYDAGTARLLGAPPGRPEHDNPGIAVPSESLLPKSGKAIGRGGTGVSAIPAEVALGAPGRTQNPQSTGRHLVLVANGRASGLSGSRRGCFKPRAQALGLRGARVETHLTESIAELAGDVAGLPGSARRSARRRRNAARGGQPAPRARRSSRILPAGRANNVARALGIPLDLDAAAELATWGGARSLDLISATSGTPKLPRRRGGERRISRARPGQLSRGELSATSAPRSGRRLGRHAASTALTLCVSSDGEPEMLTVGQLFVANLALYAFGLRVAPRARPDDGLLDVVALPWEGRARPDSDGGPAPARHACPPPWHAHLDGRAGAESRRRGESPVIADTTNLGTGPVTLEVDPAALPVVAP